MVYCFLQALLKRNSDLTPSTHEQASILALVTKIQGVLDNLSITPGSFDAAVSVILLSLGCKVIHVGMIIFEAEIWAHLFKASLA